MNTYRCVVYARFCLDAEDKQDAIKAAEEMVWRGLEPMEEAGFIEDAETDVEFVGEADF